MATTDSLLVPAELALARARPVVFVIRSAALFAGFFSLLSLVAAMLSTTWAAEMLPGRTLFVACFAGILGALVNLWLARRSSTPSGLKGDVQREGA